MIAVLIPLTQQTSKHNVLEDHIPMRTNMIGIKDKTVKVPTFSVIEKKIEFILKSMLNH